jgi:PAS domain S-box-containing protein
MRRRSRVRGNSPNAQAPKAAAGKSRITPKAVRRLRSSADQADDVDIDDRRKTVGAIREGEYKLRQIIDTVPSLVWATGPDGENTYANQRLLEYIGVPREDFKNRGWQRFVHPDDLPETVKAFHHAIKTGTSYEVVHRVRRSDGEFRWHHDRGEPLRDREGRIIQWYGLSIDIDEAKKAEASLQTVQAELARVSRLTTLGQLTASIAHEVTQPIASSRNNARAALNFLDRQPPDLSEVKEALECVVADADRAGDIIERIRDQIKKAHPRKDRFDLNEAINEVIVLARGEITKNRVSVETHLMERALPVQGDRVQLQQVVLNLILNAVEAMGSVQKGPRELSISTERTQANGFLVTVRDTGRGIDPENIERVFEAFYTTKSSGVGMGLSICRSIIEAHGGRLWADANEPRGAVFQFTVPSVEKELMNSASR